MSARRCTDYAITVFSIAFFVFMLLPILVVVAVSFTSASYVAFPIPGFSLKWFARVVEYRPFLDSFLVSLEIAVASAALAAFVGVPAALALTRSRWRIADALLTFLLSPLSMPFIVLGFALLFYLSALGFGVSFLSLLVAHTVVSLPYIVKTVAGVYRGISPQYEESAMALGASRLQVFWHVTLPMIAPATFAGALFAMLISIDNLALSFFFGSAQTNTLPVVVLSYLENQFDPSVAAVSTLQLAVAVIGLIALDRVFGLRSLTQAM